MKFNTDSQQHSPTMEHQNLHWNDTEYKLKFVLDNPNLQLPQIVKVERGYMVDEDNNLASGQILTLHGKKMALKEGDMLVELYQGQRDIESTTSPTKTLTSRTYFIFSF